MFIRALLTTALAVMVCATPSAANTTTIIGTAGVDAFGVDATADTSLEQQWVNEALVPTPALTVTVTPGQCPTAEAPWCATRTIPARVWTGAAIGYMWAASDPSIYPEGDRLLTRLTFLHEIGHVFDLLTPGQKGYRKAFARAMKYKDWRSMYNHQREWNYEEQFAMAYGFCAMYPHYTDAEFARSVWWGYDYYPTPRQYEQACFVIRHASEYGRDGRIRLAH